MAGSSGCEHLLSALKRGTQSLDNYILAIRWGSKLLEARATTSTSTSVSDHDSRLKALSDYVVPSDMSSAPQISSSCCSTCSATPTRPCLCLNCGKLSCGPNSHSASHLIQHAEQFDHAQFWDMCSRAIYCVLCNDYIFHPSIERLVASEAAAAAALSNRVGKSVRTVSVSGMARQCNETSESLEATGHGSKGALSPRGMRNLGQTCYLSVVLQAFIHNPLLRDHYLSDRHNRKLCRQSAKDSVCIACEMDRLFSEVTRERFSSFLDIELMLIHVAHPMPCVAQYCTTSESPCGPTQFLHAIWQSSSDLSGYAQQDAHECLISALNHLHMSSPGSSPSTDCTCVVHSTFAGQLRSQVTCGRCRTTTSSTELFLDLSLDLQMSSAATSLNDCLERFTRSEQLAENAYKCATCGDSEHAASKQLSIDRMPPVLCIQLKRFEHTHSSQKLDKPVRYPLALDMQAFMSTRLDTPLSRSSPRIDATSSEVLYQLNSVVSHEGSLSTGHYTVLCRGDDDFWNFDDEKIRRAPLSEVLNMPGAYLLFYVRGDH
ncbi:BQ2448_7439 [Microbotryum intermedium]|uniref:Ubiquitin carboxyl-terminal hydrolase n=1 Tax=Microbotryum intermedium TaxID=269621 RepID=A0A238FNE0_9BASI|nr:BQ2448_7439 [Microbotryum intermedium]